MNNSTDRITLFESTDGEIRITATEEKIYIETPFNAAFKDELKSRFRARWNSDTKEWIIAFRYRDDLDPLLYDHFGVSMIAEVTTPSLMKVSIDMTDLYLAGPLDRSELSLAGRRLVKRWARDRKVEIADGVQCFEEDGVTPFDWPASGGSNSLPALIQAGTKYQPLGHGRLIMGITPAELDWLRENEIDFELLDGGQSAEPEPEDPQLDPEDLNGLHEDDETWDVDDDDEDRVYVQEEEEEEEEPAEAEVEVETKSDEDKEESEMKKYHVKADGSMGVCKAQDGNCPLAGEGAKHFTNEAEAQACAEKIIKTTTDKGGMKMKKNMKEEDFMSIDPITMDDRKEKETKMNEDRVAETKAKSFTTPTNATVVKAWEAFAKRVAEVDDPNADVEIERGSRQVFGIGGAGDIIRGIELRKEDPTPAEELDAWMRVSYFMGDVFPRFVNPDEDRALFLVDEWNDLMDSIANDEGETTPEIRQAAEDQKIIALGRQNGSVIGMEVYDDGVDMDEIISLRKYDATATITNSHTTPAGVHEATYVGWDGDDEIIYSGGWIDGSFVSSDEVGRAGLFDQLSEDVKAEMEPLAGDNPALWNGKILEIQDNVDPKDAEILDALWIGAEVFGGAVVIFGIDDGVTKMDEYDFKILGLHRTYEDSYNTLGR